MARRRDPRRPRREYGGTNAFDRGPLGEWTDIVVVIVFSVAMYYWAVATAQSPAAVQDAVREDEEQIRGGEVLNVPMG